MRTITVWSTNRGAFILWGTITVCVVSVNIALRGTITLWLEVIIMVVWARQKGERRKGKANYVIYESKPFPLGSLKNYRKLNRYNCSYDV